VINFTSLTGDAYYKIIPDRA